MGGGGSIGATGQAAARACGLFASRLGRRMVSLFLISALLPIVGLAWLALAQVSQQLARENERTLQHGATTAGLALSTRIAQLASDLRLAADAVALGEQALDPGTLLHGYLGERFESLQLVRGPSTQLLLGAETPPPPLPTPAQRQHLLLGRTALQVTGDPPRLALLLLLDPAAAEPVLFAGTIRGDFLWDIAELRIAGDEVAVLDDSCRSLFRSFAGMPDCERLRWALALEPASGSVEWEVGGERHVARYFRVFLRLQYAIDLLVVQSRSQQLALQAVRGLEQWFAFAAGLALLFVLATGLGQLRQLLGPIVRLREATRRIASGDFATKVATYGRDELGDVGRAFDHMTGKIVESMRQREQMERELVASRDEALAAARAKAAFVTNVSHEFRTPMTAILAAVEILQHAGEHDDPAVRSEFARIAAGEARRLARLVDDVLELSGNGGWAMEPTAVEDSIADALAFMPPEVAARVRLQLEAGLPPVFGMRERLAQLFWHLLDNAAKFSPPTSEITLRATTARESLVVEIEDHGSGIEAKDLRHIFEPFSQVGRDQLTDKAHGMGLGLTVARNIVQRHGGRIEVESLPGQGSLFRVVLPALRPDAVAGHEDSGY